MRQQVFGRLRSCPPFHHAIASQLAWQRRRRNCRKPLNVRMRRSLRSVCCPARSRWPMHAIAVTSLSFRCSRGCQTHSQSHRRAHRTTAQHAAQTVAEMTRCARGGALASSASALDSGLSLTPTPAASRSQGHREHDAFAVRCIAHSRIPGWHGHPCIASHGRGWRMGMDPRP